MSETAKIQLEMKDLINIAKTIYHTQPQNLKIHEPRKEKKREK